MMARAGPLWRCPAGENLATAVPMRVASTMWSRRPTVPGSPARAPASASWRSRRPRHRAAYVCWNALGRVVPGCLRPVRSAQGERPPERPSRAPTSSDRAPRARGGSRTSLRGRVPGGTGCPARSVIRRGVRRRCGRGQPSWPGRARRRPRSAGRPGRAG